MMLHAVFPILVPATKLAKYQIEVIKELKLVLRDVKCFHEMLVLLNTYSFCFCKVITNVSYVSFVKI